MSELFNLNGKTALVTGSSRGLGFAFAQALAEHGADVILNGTRVDRLEQRHNCWPFAVFAPTRWPSM